MRLKPNALAQILRQPNYTLGHAQSYPAVAPAIPHALIEPDAWENPLGAEQDEGGCQASITVRIERRGTKLLDKDNLYGSVKFLADALRYQGLIPADDPEAINLFVTQKKVKKDQTGTLIQITRT